MHLYIVTRPITKYISNWRVSGVHALIYHGHLDRNIQQEPYPCLTNEERRPLRIVRSGAIVPRVQLPNRQLIVDAHLMNELSHFENVAFLQVDYERLVDLPMPPLGEFTMLKEYADASIDGDLGRVFRSRPDVPDFHRTIGPHYQVLCADFHDLKDKYDNIVEIVPNWGSYGGFKPRPMEVSASMSARYPFVSSGPITMREDVFKLLAPHLDLDHCGVAWVDV